MKLSKQAERLAFSAGWSEVVCKVNAMTSEERGRLARELESAALFCAMTAEYLTMRAGCGSGDQGHKAALRKANRIGRKVWVGGFGYNGFTPVNVGG